MGGHFCLVPRVSVRDRYYCTSVIYLVQNLFPKHKGESQHQFELARSLGPRHVRSHTHNHRNVTSEQLQAIAVGEYILSVEEAFEVKGRSQRAESQHVDDGDTFIVQTLKHGWCHVLHPNVLDVTNTCPTRQFVSFQPGRIFPQIMFTLIAYIWMTMRLNVANEWQVRFMLINVHAVGVFAQRPSNKLGGCIAECIDYDVHFKQWLHLVKFADDTNFKCLNWLVGVFGI